MRPRARFAEVKVSKVKVNVSNKVLYFKELVIQIEWGREGEKHTELSQYKLEQTGASEKETQCFGVSGKLWSH